MVLEIVLFEMLLECDLDVVVENRATFAGASDDTFCTCNWSWYNLLGINCRNLVILDANLFILICEFPFFFVSNDELNGSNTTLPRKKKQRKRKKITNKIHKK